MCLKCELKGINMTLKPISLEQAKETVELPNSWQELLVNGFSHDDLRDRTYAHLFWTRRKYENHKEEDIKVKNVRSFQSALAKGYMEKFDRGRFAPQKGDEFFKLKNSFLDAIEELADDFYEAGNRISSVLWDSLAHLGSREKPEESRSILKEKDILPHHYGIVDAHLHALGKVYSLLHHVNSVVFKHTGRILDHNCDCSCSLINLVPIEGSMKIILPKRRYFEATQSLFTHLCAESELILNEKLPFEYCITREAEYLLN